MVNYISGVTVCACIDIQVYAGNVYVLRKDVTSCEYFVSIATH